MALTKVSTDGVKDDAITKAKIPANQIENSELANNAVSTVNIAANTVTTAILQDASVTLAKLEHGTSSNDGKFLRANNGADPTFETVTGTTINNNADSRIITGSDTANTLEGEDRLLWNGTSLTLEKNQNAYLNPELNLYNSFNGGWGAGITFSGKYSGSKETQARIRVYGGQNANDASMAFETGNPNEIIRLLPSGGITFNGDTSAANALDDYEEGTWTPVIGSGSTTNIYSPRYTKIGNLCTISFSAYGFSDNSSNTSLYFTGLPFTSDSQGGAGLSVGACFTAKFTIAANIISYVGASSTTIRFYDHGTGDYDAVRHNHINGTDTTHRIFTTITYTTA